MSSACRALRSGVHPFDILCLQRKPHPFIVTAFVACVGYRAMYFAPKRPLEAPVMPPGHGHGIGGPEPRPDSGERLKRDAAEAAKGYIKPGRSGRLKPSGR